MKIENRIQFSTFILLSTQRFRNPNPLYGLELRILSFKQLAAQLSHGRVRRKTCSVTNFDVMLKQGATLQAPGSSLQNRVGGGKRKCNGFQFPFQIKNPVTSPRYDLEGNQQHLDSSPQPNKLDAASTWPNNRILNLPLPFSPANNELK